MLLEKIEKYVADYDVIPVKKEIYADLVTPIALFFPWVRSGHEGILLSG